MYSEQNGWDDTNEILLPGDVSKLPDAAVKYLYNQTKQIMGLMIDYKELRMIYACAMKEIKTKFEILNTEFSLQYHRNPINSIRTRLKSTTSIVNKLRKLNMPVSIDGIEENIHDIAGIRVVCSYVDDVYSVADALLKQDDIISVSKKDYIAQPKSNGYRSLHLIVKVPVFLAERRIETEVEVQLRTIAMDFWASLEHQLHYKNDGEEKDDIASELKACADVINETDMKMMNIRTKIEENSSAPTEDELLFEKFCKFDTPIF